MLSYFLEFVGTFILVFLVSGSIAFNPGISAFEVGIVAGFGLTSIIFTFGSLSGAHVNPAVTLCLALSKKICFRKVPLYIGSQLLGGFCASAFVHAITKHKGNFIQKSLTGFNALSPEGYSKFAVFSVELLVTFVFLLTILATTRSYFSKGVGAVSIGLCLAALIVVAAPISNASLNFARSLGPALFVSMTAVQELWIFLLAHTIAAFAAAFAAPKLLPETLPQQ